MKYFKFLSSVILVAIAFTFLNSSDSEEVKVIDHKSTVMVASESSILNLMYNDKYETIVDYIKKHEGFCRTPYKCPAGYLTIGYGHLIQKGEVFDEINEVDAEILLRFDLNKAINLAEKLSPELNKLQQLAIGHFIYSLGCGTYMRSSLRKMINSGYPIESIGEEFIKYCNYVTPNGNIKRSELAYKMRVNEYSMFFTGDSIRVAYENYDTLTSMKIIYYDI